ncbi:MAG: penicillin-binding protein activator [Gallionella sp.]|nr:penicillin-binding protein activator [Gallionella sp.]
MQRLFLSWMMGVALCMSTGVHAVELSTTIPTPIAVPHIALLLPLKSPAFSAAASAVAQGFIAASTIGQKTLPVRVYDCTDENNEIIALYAQALASGAQAVVGPLTRKGAALIALQPNIKVPTLVLNTIEENSEFPLYSFGMAVEAEARLVAQQAAQTGLRNAIVIGSMSPFDLRMQFAFEEAWSAIGGTINREIEFNGDLGQLADMTMQPDTLIFLAGNAQQARVMRPYLPSKLPIYATSQIFANYSPTNFELNGIRFVDMPWLVQADHPAVRAYPRANPPLPVELERLYALGVDAFRLIQLVIQNQLSDALPLNGVSGEIRLSGHQFLRSAAPAVFVQGRAQSTDADTTEVRLFPGQARNQP